LDEVGSGCERGSGEQGEGQVTEHGIEGWRK
jgi:hypothetical protein